VPANTEWERFDSAVGKLLSVPRAAFPREEVKLKRPQGKEAGESGKGGNEAQR